MNLSNKIIELKNIARELRINTIKVSSTRKIPHLGSCLSCTEILTVLYFKILNVDPSNPNKEGRDRFFLSKGHAAPILFQVLAKKKFFPKELLNEFGKPGSLLHEHPPKNGYIPGVEAATGSLGHGFSMALGMAVGSKISKKEFTSFALLGDGECNEGSIWEGAMVASSQKIGNLIAIIDFNKWQGTDRSEKIMGYKLKEKWQSFGWDASEIDGHNLEQLIDALENAKNNKEKPTAIIAHTIKGKGISFMEDDNNWHYKTPSPEELKLALKELI